jgi:hypothetical protein
MRMNDVTVCCFNIVQRNIPGWFTNHFLQLNQRWHIGYIIGALVTISFAWIFIGMIQITLTTHIHTPKNKKFHWANNEWFYYCTNFQISATCVLHMSRCTTVKNTQCRRNSYMNLKLMVKNALVCVCGYNYIALGQNARTIKNACSN